MEINKAVEKLYALQEKLTAYNHALAILQYDGETAAPKGTAENRARTVNVLSEESYRLQTSEETVALLDYLDAHKESLNPEEQRMTELLIKEQKRKEKIPMDEYLAFEELKITGYEAWFKAKMASDFEIFRPYLEKIFYFVKRFAGYCCPDKKPYDYWLGYFEEGLDTKLCDEFFGLIKAEIIPLIEITKSCAAIDDKVLKGDFPEYMQERLSYELMKTMGLGLDHVGFSTTEHPFTTTLGSHLDERITTHYIRDDFSSSMFSVIHESGHALYDTGSDDRYAFTVLDGGVSMGIHESQSRFYENILGRSRAFADCLFGFVKKYFPGRSAYSTEDFYRAINRVQPSLIRTEADEVTYPLHVLIRYEIERAVFEDKLAVKDIPAEWNSLYKKYLGVDVPDDRRGVLQDMHWSDGSIGYFPSYALGSAYGVQFIAKMRETVDVDNCLKTGNFAPVNAWNREHIWKYGQLYKPDKLLNMVLGEPFDPHYYIEYLKEKVRSVYAI